MKKSGVIAMLLTAILCLSLMPAAALAEECNSYGLSNPRTEAFINTFGEDDYIGTWDCIYFGNYPQSDITGAETEPIKWRVLSVDGDDAFLLADRSLDCQPYYTEWAEVTWETSALRAWLNDDFYNNAFSSSEQSAIMTTTVINEDHPKFGTDSGNNTQDKVFLLSISESLNEEYGFPNDPSVRSATRWSKNTAYTAERGAYSYFSNDETYIGNGRGYWWLRSPGINGFLASYVIHYGDINQTGSNVNAYDFSGIRPAIHLDLSSSSWIYAGTVCSDGTVCDYDPGTGDDSGGSRSGVTPGGEETAPGASYGEDN